MGCLRNLALLYGFGTIFMQVLRRSLERSNLEPSSGQPAGTISKCIAHHSFVQSSQSLMEAEYSWNARHVTPACRPGHACNSNMLCTYWHSLSNGLRSSLS